MINRLKAYAIKLTDLRRKDKMLGSWNVDVCFRGVSK